jgi:hypothetical protein
MKHYRTKVIAGNLAELFCIDSLDETLVYGILPGKTVPAVFILPVFDI